MMALLFALLLITMLLAWLGKRKWAITLFVVALILTVFWFSHHITSHININL